MTKTPFCDYISRLQKAIKNRGEKNGSVAQKIDKAVLANAISYRQSHRTAAKKKAK